MILLHQKIVKSRITIDTNFQTQSFTGVLQNECFEGFCKFYRKTPVLEFHFSCSPEVLRETPTQVLSCEILRDLLEHLFLQNTSCSCFCNFRDLWNPLKSCFACFINFIDSRNLRYSYFVFISTYLCCY